MLFYILKCYKYSIFNDLSLKGLKFKKWVYKRKIILKI